MIETREFALSKAEYRRLLQRLALQRTTVILALLWAMVGYFLFGEGQGFSSAALWRAAASAAPLLFMTLFFTLWVAWLGPVMVARSKRSRPVYLRQSVVFGNSQLEMRLADGSRFSRPYSAIERVEQSDEMLLLRQDTGHHFVIPRHAFENDTAMADAIALVKGNSSAESAADGPDSDTPAVPPNLLAGLKKNLRAGQRILTFRDIEQPHFVVSADQLVVLFLISSGIYFVGDYLAIEGPVMLSDHGVAVQLATTLLMLAGIYLVARIFNRMDGFLLLAVVLMSTEPWLAIAYSAVTQLPAEEGWTLNLLNLALFLWYVSVWIRAARLVLPDRPARIPVTVAVLFVVAVLPVWWMPYADLWYSMDMDEEPPEVNVEDVYYAQPGMISAALDGLSPQRPGVIDLYHIGFGSDSGQSVFRREIGHVKDILDSGFDTAGRSMALVNHPDVLQLTPIASASNLRLALKGLAQRMDTEEDVLLLYLTSHGSRNGTLSVSFWPLQLNDMTATDLRTMLDEAGIRWRVIVVSACYAGSFVEALKDDRTLVITAAARDRNSFGCANENEYTYFGEAYFKKALPETRSFIDAFERAREIVVSREQAEDLKPSRPVISIGPEAEPHLRALEQRLASLQVPAG